MSACTYRCGFTAAVAIAVLTSGSAAAQNGGPSPISPEPTHGHASATRLATTALRRLPIVLDGRLDDAAWAEVAPSSDFIQREPEDGQPATQRTEVRILHDEDALYIGARMFDTEGALGVRTRLVRRDQQTESDWLEVTFDTFHDHVGRTVFAVNPSGVKRDAGQASEFADPSWDPIWEAKTLIDSLGWTAELRIPLSQLRFPTDSVQTWGLQLFRVASRINEVSMWAHWPLGEPGGPQRYGHLEGLAMTGGTRRLEVMPYVVGRGQFLRPGNPADPFFDQRSADSRFGADIKYNLSSNLTLAATINPDFGQVEVDPAVVNLSAFETFFPERRPFFIEGSGVFGFGGFNCNFCSNVSSMSLFYSRRVGRAPQGDLPAGTEYSSRPDASSILGAAKLTGRTPGGWTLGVLNAVTGRQHAEIVLDGARGAHEVEPLTNYLVARARRDNALGRDLSIGGIVTSVYRSTSEPMLTSRLTSHAEAVGVDWHYRWNGRAYSFMGNMAATNVAGEATAIDRIQRSSARYFQRPDRQGGAYDPDLTSLRGWGGYARVAKQAGDWQWEAAINFRTGGFEANDMAFLTRADYFYHNANLLRIWNRPSSWYRQLHLLAGGQQQYNFDGDMTDRQFQAFFYLQTLNYWNINGFVIRRTEVADDRLTRGGPVVHRAGNLYYNLNINSDSRRMLSVGLNGNTGITDDGYRSYGISANTMFRPASNLSLSVSPGWNVSDAGNQYVTARPAPELTAFGGTRYIFADARQKNLSFDTRINYTMSPGLTLELYAQPFISSVKYDRFKEFTETRSTSRRVFAEDGGTVTTTSNAAGQVTGYTIDPDGSGASAPFSLSNPDFNLRSLRGNMVVRWEYRPGSTLFLVWTRSGSDFSPFTDDFRMGRDVDAMFGAKADNVFLVKMTYWLNR